MKRGKYKNGYTGKRRQNEKTERKHAQKAARRNGEHSHGRTVKTIRNEKARNGKMEKRQTLRRKRHWGEDTNKKRRTLEKKKTFKEETQTQKTRKAEERRNVANEKRKNGETTETAAPETLRKGDK